MVSIAPLDSRRFHTHAALAYTAFLAFAVIGCRLSSISLPGGKSLPLVLAICLAIVAPIPAYWHEKHSPARREAALAPLWVLVFSFTLPFVVDVCGRSPMPLQDAHLAQLDTLFGVNVPAIATWADHHRLGHFIDLTYPMLIFDFIPLATLAPAIFGRWVAAREFFVANVIALLIGLTTFTLFPAIGPWYGYHTPPGPGQDFCQAQLLLLRQSGPIVAQAAGIVCFPSFHVIWAILCARALWTFRLFRIPTAIFSVLIILSTLTTGWHYFTDVLAGAGVAYIAIRVASRFIDRQPTPAANAPHLQIATQS